MSSGSLISSLFRDNSFSSRSSSMFHKNFLKPEPTEERSRSQSVYPDKNTYHNTSNRYLPVARMAHTLAVKVKKLNYFLFCRLQANLKKSRLTQPNIQNSSIELKKQQSQPITFISKNQNQKKEKIIKGLECLSQIIQLNQLKYQNQTKISNSFKKIKQFGQKKESISALFKIMSNNLKIKNSSSFKSLKCKEKTVLRAEIFLEVTVHVLQPKLKNIFNKINIYAANQKKKQNQNTKFIDPEEGYYIGSYQNPRLKSISEQSSSMVEQQQTARFNTPEKKKSSQKNKQYQQQLQKSKTSRKQSKILQLMKKQTRKQFTENQLDYIAELYLSSSKKFDCQAAEQRQKSHSIKASTKRNPLKTKIAIGKAYKIETALVDKNIIEFKKGDKLEQKQCMLKNNRLYSENVGQMLPDLHDNIGVFEELSVSESDDYAYSHRTIEKPKNQWVELENSKTVSHCRASETKNQRESSIKEDIQFFQVKNGDDITFVKEMNEKNVVTASSRAISNSFSSPKFCVETGINTSTVEKDVKMPNQKSKMGQFYSSPLQNIEEMMIDLEKLRERQRYSSKYTAGYQRCKISVNLPKKSIEGRSYQGSASKINGNLSKTGINECKSEKKQLKKQAFKRFSYKQNSKQQKQNIQVKLWDEKQKLFFYPNQTKQRKKSSGLITTMNQSQINTARKMKKQIQNIINNRKSRTSLGTLKLARNKF